MDKVMEKARKLILELAEKYEIQILSIVLYGSRARGDYSFNSDYDIFILLGNNTTLLQFVQFVSELRMISHSLGELKIYACAEDDFKTILNENMFVGAFCYIIAVEGRAIYENEGAFQKIKSYVEGFPVPAKKQFLDRCVDMSKRLGSPRWVSHWREKMRNAQ